MKQVGDGLSVFVVIGALASWLPPLSALAALIYTCVRIFETRTVQALLKRWGAAR